jgi:hypothetical protein
MNVKRLIGLFPPLYFIHDLEEIVTVEKFVREHGDAIPLPVTTLQFTIAFGLLLIVSSAGCYQAMKGKRFLGMSPVALFTFLVPGLLLANGVAHILQAIYFRAYVPGVITAVCIIFPYCFFALKALRAEKLASWKKLSANFLIAFVAQGPLALAALFIGKLVA